MGAINVLELGGNIAAAYTTRLLIDCDATVIKLELPQGDRLRAKPPLFTALNAGKQSVVADYQSSPAELAAWLSWADILIHDFAPQQALPLKLDPLSLTRSYPKLVVCAITPFGQTGPYADYAATELTISNAGGWANLCPATHTDPDLPPLKAHGDHCQMMAAVCAATTTLACYRQALATGVGEFIDFSIQAYVASVLEAAIPAYSYRGEVINRTYPRSLIPWRIFQTQDDPVFIVCIEQDQWQRLVKFMGDPDWATLPAFADQPARQENQDLVHTLVAEFVSQWSAQDLYHAAQAERICVAPVMNLQQLSENEHLKARSFFVEHQGTTYMAPATLTTSGRAPFRGSAPALNEHLTETLEETETAKPRSTGPSGLEGEALATAHQPAQPAPLDGIRVIDLTWVWAGAFCTLNLAHLGAEVIRIESSLRPDLYRRLPVYPEGIEEGLNCSGMFNQWNQGKASMTINLTTAEGISLVKDLVKTADVVVQNFATGVMDRLGLGYEALKAVKPDIILASISGYGQTGPCKDYIGYGPAIPPLTGLSAATGYLDGEADEIGLSMPDPTAGITAACAVMGALLRRDVSGLGDHLDVSLWEATAALNAEAWMDFQATGKQPSRQGNRSSDMIPHGVFACQSTAEDRNWVAIACRSDSEWQALADLLEIDNPEWLTHSGRQQAVDEIEAIVTAWTQAQDRWTVTELLQAPGIAAFPTFTTADIVADPHLNERGFIERLPHPEVGRRAHSGIPWRLSRRANGVRSAAPCIDADTDRYLETLLGLDQQAITQLRDKGIVGC